MLELECARGDSICVGNDLTITIIWIGVDSVEFDIDAPPSVLDRMGVASGTRFHDPRALLQALGLVPFEQENFLRSILLDDLSISVAGEQMGLSSTEATKFFRDTLALVHDIVLEHGPNAGGDTAEN